MDAINILAEIRGRECSMLGLYKRLADENVAAAAAGLNVSFESVKLLRESPSKITDNIKASFQANTSTIFTLGVKRISLSNKATQITDDNRILQEIRAHERKIILELRDIAIQDPSVAAGCCGLSFEQVDSLRTISAGRLIDFTYEAHASGPLFKIKFNKDRAFAELIKVGRKPCFNNFGLLMDRVAC